MADCSKSTESYAAPLCIVCDMHHRRKELHRGNRDVGCPKQRKPKHTFAEFRSLSAEEARRLLATASQGKYFTLIYVALATGMRQREVFGLQWEAVNFDHSFVSVVGTLTRNRDGKPSLQASRGKTHRRIDLSPYAARMLSEQCRGQQPPSPRLFADSDGNTTSKDNFLHRVFRPLRKKAGTDRLRFHDLRHTSATLSLAAGENVKIVQETLCHASAKMTLDVRESGPNPTARGSYPNGQHSHD